MKIIDRYIGKKFFFTFFFIIILVAFLTYIFDYLEKGNYFLEHNLSKKEVLNYYLAYIPYMLNFTTPVIVFITSVFTTLQLAKKSEILAIHSLGIHFRRLILSFLFPASVLMGISFYTNGWIISKNNVHWISFEEKYFDNYDSKSNQKKNLHFKVNDDRYVSIGIYKSIQKVGYNIIVDTFKENELHTRITADRMYYDNETDEWILANWMQRVLNQYGEEISSGDTMRTNIILKPTDIAMNPRLQDMLTLTELNKEINILKEQGSKNIKFFQVERDSKLMSPFAIIILTIIGVLFASKRRRIGNTFQLIIGGILGFVYIGLFLFTKSLAIYSDINTTLAVWLPNIIFFVITFLLYKLMPR